MRSVKFWRSICDVQMRSALLHALQFCEGTRLAARDAAMEAGVSDHVWSIEEIAALVPEPTFGQRGPYKKNIS